MTTDHAWILPKSNPFTNIPKSDQLCLSDKNTELTWEQWPSAARGAPIRPDLSAERVCNLYALEPTARIQGCVKKQ